MKGMDKLAMLRSENVFEYLDRIMEEHKLRIKVSIFVLSFTQK